jgi:hypothetical protein
MIIVMGQKIRVSSSAFKLEQKKCIIILFLLKILYDIAIVLILIFSEVM